MYVTQRTYIERMAIKYGMDKSKRVDTPIPAGTSMVDNAGLPLDDDKPFRQIVGSLLYCAMSTRPDIVHAVAQLSRHLSTPHQLHMFMAKRTVAYLLHTKEVGITVWTNLLEIQAPSLVTLSSTAAEYVGACLGAQHGMHLDNLMNELGLKDNGKTVTLYLNNQSDIAIGSNQSSVQSTKHLALRFYFLRDLVRAGKFKLVYLPTNVMPADVLIMHVTGDKLRVAMCFMGMGGYCGFCP
ncbi:hypothetical protein AaE_000677 [Aphanomyces astaci]|uniref:Reverse transcriptase Ty1/copia-type domain-containing protein n=1 Tax=Aphanomyces astaci TaxID=112090 RepID=A0A6A5B0N8_APHAT|nr:hypothetical protein AaE_000677 [Aphanomyces astaci]